MARTTMIDPDTIGQMFVEGVTIINDHTDASDGYELGQWFASEVKRGDPLRTFQLLIPLAREFLEDASILNDEAKQLRVSVAHDVMSGVLASFGIEA